MTFLFFLLQIIPFVVGPKTPPSVPVLVSPANEATGVSQIPIFEWNETAGRNTFDLQVDDDQNFGSPILDSTGISFLVAKSTRTLAQNTVYYWHVRAVGNGGTSAYSTARSFTSYGFDSSGTYVNLDFEEADSTAFWLTHPHAVGGINGGWYMEPPGASGTGTAPTFSTTYASTGSGSLKSYCVEQCKSRLWWTPAGMPDSIVFSFDIYLPTGWTAYGGEDVMYIQEADGVGMIKLFINSSQQILLVNNGTTLATSSNAISLDTWTTVKFKGHWGGTGDLYFGVSFGGTTTSVTTCSDCSATSRALTNVGWGRGDQSSGATVIYFDNMHFGGISWP